MTKLLVRLFVKNYNDTANSDTRTAYGKLVGYVGIACNVFLCLAKLIIGTLSNSISITADAINNLSDAASSVITLIGFKLAARPADDEHPFGHARIEYISGLAVAVLILIIGYELVQSSIDKILNPTQVDFSFVTAIVLIIAIVTKLWMMFFDAKIGKDINSPTIKAMSADSRNDVITTSAVLLGSIIAHFANINLDGIIGLCVAIFILISGIGIIKDTIDPLLGKAPTEEFTKHVANKILSYEGVLGMHDLMVHEYGPSRRFASAHVEMDASVDVMESHNIIDDIERDFLRDDNIHLVLHFDPILIGDVAVGTKREWMLQKLKTISPQLTLHDFRMVSGPSHTNLIFDVVVPHDFTMSETELRKKIQELVEQEDKKYYTVITIDKGFVL